MPFSPRDKESVVDSIKNSDVVVNLIGKYYETKHIVPTRRENGQLSRINYSYEDVHVTIPKMLAELSKEAGIAFIHVSSMSANLGSKSEWSRSKARGEIAVREANRDAVSHLPIALPCSDYLLQIIVRPATIFGPEDRFLNLIAESFARLPFAPLVHGGSTLCQPVYSVDVGKALMQIIHVSFYS